MVELFVNPTPGNPLPEVADATKSDKDTGHGGDIGLVTNAQIVFDEVRSDISFSDVAPVTQPV
jgi:hypothetical protein